MFILKITLGIILFIILLIYVVLAVLFLYLQIKTIKRIKSVKFSWHLVIIGPFEFIYESIVILGFIIKYHLKA